MATSTGLKLRTVQDVIDILGIADMRLTKRRAQQFYKACHDLSLPDAPPDTGNVTTLDKARRKRAGLVP